MYTSQSGGYTELCAIFHICCFRGQAHPPQGPGWYGRLAEVWHPLEDRRILADLYLPAVFNQQPARAEARQQSLLPHGKCLVYMYMYACVNILRLPYLTCAVF